MADEKVYLSPAIIKNNPINLNRDFIARRQTQPWQGQILYWGAQDHSDVFCQEPLAKWRISGQAHRDLRTEAWVRCSCTAMGRSHRDWLR